MMDYAKAKALLAGMSKHEFIKLMDDYQQRQTQPRYENGGTWGWKTSYVTKLIETAKDDSTRSDWYATVKSLPTTLVKTPALTSETIPTLRAIWEEEICGLEEVYEQLVGYVIASFRGEDIPPLLFYGPPATGKTTVARNTAKMFGRPSYKIDCPTLGDGVGLSGDRKVYAGSKVGELILAAIVTQCGNPVVILEEFEKAIGYSHYVSIEDTLLGLTDGSSAASFRDNYLGFCTDLSHYSYILICNDIDAVGSAMRSRAEMIAFPQPSVHEIADIIQKKFIMELVRDLPHVKVEQNVSNALAASRLSSVRDYRKALQKAVQSADILFLKTGKPQIVTADNVIAHIKATYKESNIGF